MRGLAMARRIRRLPLSGFAVRGSTPVSDSRGVFFGQMLRSSSALDPLLHNLPWRPAEIGPAELLFQP
jgi:hypothetical protein